MMHIPVLRWGEPYRSMDVDTIVHFETGDPLAEMSRANGGLVERDLRHARRARQALRELPIPELLSRLLQAADLYLEGTLPLGDATLSAVDFVRLQSAATGLPE